MRRFAFVLAVFLPASAQAAHYASLKSDKVYLREGPTYQHRVLFIYKRRDYPLEVIAAYEGWRRVRDVDGTIGWVSDTMLSDRRTVLVTGKAKAQLRAQPSPTASVSADAEPGVVAKLKACQPRFCEVTAGGITGWIEKDKIWGVDAGETFN
jgi:SH3-like domain-containing protein